MPRKRFNDDSDEDKFESEALQFLNKERNEAKNDSGDSDDEIEEEEDDEDKQTDQSDDEAPESIGFQESRKSVLSQFRTAMLQVDQERQRQKEKRKQKEILFKEQKEKKMKYINETKLPDEILEGIDSEIPRNMKQKKKMMKREQKDEKEEGKVQLPTHECSTDSKKDKRKQDRHNKTKDMPNPILSDDYIPLVDSESGIEVAQIKQYEKQVKSLAQKAADFRNSRLNSRDIPRETNKARLLKLEKRRARVKLN